MAIDIELQEQQHIEMQELMQSNQAKIELLLNDILKAVSVEKKNDDIVKVITDSISTFIGEIRQIKIHPAEVNIEPAQVNVNQDNVIKSIEDSTTKLVNELAKIKPVSKQLEKWKFDFYRNDDGIIVSTNAEQIK